MCVMCGVDACVNLPKTPTEMFFYTTRTMCNAVPTPKKEPRDLCKDRDHIRREIQASSPSRRDAARKKARRERKDGEESVLAFVSKIRTNGLRGCFVVGGWWRQLRRKSLELATKKQQPKNPWTSKKKNKDNTYLQFGTPSHHLAKRNSNTLNNRQQDRTSNSTIPRRLVPATNRQRATRKEPSNNSIVGVLLLADPLDGTVKCRKETTPHAEIAAEDGGAHLDGGDGAYSSFAVGGVSVAFDAVPDCTANSLMGRGSVSV